VDWRFALAFIRAGDCKRAIELTHTYMRLDPFYTPFATYVLGFAHYMLEQYPQALALLRDYVAEAPNHGGGHGLLAATLAQIGQLEEARAEMGAALRLGAYTTARARRLASFKYPRDDKHFFDGLREAGLPD